MPYALFKQDDKVCVKNTETGENKGCSDSRVMAIKHMRALYAAEGGDKMGKKELDEQVDQLVETAVKQYEQETGDTLTEQDWLEVKSLRLDPNDFGALHATLVSPNDEKELKFLERVFNRAINYVKSALKPPKEDTGILIFKNTHDQWVWMARYSNNFRDRDNPPEIISAASHRRFVELTEKGLAPYPELWLWHTPEWKIGKATWVAYDDTGDGAGFALAAGFFNKGCEQVAEVLAKTKGVAVSHGMPPHSVKYAPDDPSVIIEHTTREISPLPGWAAANELTGFFTITKEAEMPIMEAKKKALIEQWGISPNLLESIESLNIADAQAASDKGLEKKEIEESAATEEVKTETVTTEEVKTEQVKTEVVEAVGEPEATPQTESKQEVKETPAVEEKFDGATAKELIGAVAEVLTPFVEQVKAINTNLAALQSKVDALEKARDDQVKDTLAKTSYASLSALITESIVGSPSTEVKAGDALSDQKPKESKSQANPRTPIPFVNEFMASGK